MAKHDRAYWLAREETLQRTCADAEERGDFDTDEKVYTQIEEHHEDRRRWGWGKP